jgi:alpha-ribazole phosphatase/probable phosphoglycerate mutase
MKNSPQLVLIRHAATDMSGTFCGQSDPPINEMGRAQATALAGRLHDWPVRRLYSSDLQRARQTAEILGSTWNIPVEAKSALREISFGDWEGRRWIEVRSSGPDITLMESCPEVAAPGGESFGCFRARVLQAVTELIDDCNGHELTVIVTHLGVIRVVLTEVSLANCDRSVQPRIDHCSIVRIQLDARLRAITL